MKIISGFLKGRTISGYDIVGTRPTMSRLKESLFAMIQDNIQDKIVLDLFAGSGSLGLEAISNYAKECHFVDNNHQVIKILKQNITKLDINNKCYLYYQDYQTYLNTTNKTYDLVFLDPPYQMKIIENILYQLVNKNILNNNALVVVECQDKLLNEYPSLKLIKQKKYGDKLIYIYQKY